MILCTIRHEGFFNIFHPCYWRESSHALGQYHWPPVCLQSWEGRRAVRTPESKSRRSCVWGPSKAIYSVIWIKKKKPQKTQKKTKPKTQTNPQQNSKHKPQTTSPSCNAYVNDFLFIIFTLDFYIMDRQVFPTPRRNNKSESRDCTKWSGCYFMKLTLHILSTSTEEKRLSHTCFSALPLTSTAFWLIWTWHF